MGLGLADISPGGLVLTVDEVLSNYVYVFYAAFLVSFAFTPAMRLAAMYFGIVDEPDRVRKMHRIPVAYLGGVAVFLGWLAGLGISQFVRMHRVGPGLPEHTVIGFSIVAGAIIITLAGFWDDIWGLRPWIKILTQVFAAIFLLAEGIGTRCTGLLINPINARLVNWYDLPPIPDVVVVASSCMVVVAVVVACCNAANLMDGLDGLCGGVTAIISLGYVFLAVHLAMYSGGLNPNLDAMRVVLSLALLAAILGFVPYNFNPASIFMGDAGSMFLGFSCASMMFLMAQGQHWKWFLAAMVMFALPVLDTALAFARRWVNGRPLFSADRFHFHHQLVARGFSVKQTVLISYSLAAFFALCGAAIVFVRTRYAVAMYLVIFGSIIVAAYKMGMVHERLSPTPEPMPEEKMPPLSAADRPMRAMTDGEEPRAITKSCG